MNVYSDGNRLDQRRTGGFYTIEVYQVLGIARLRRQEATLLLEVFNTLRTRLSMRRPIVCHYQSYPTLVWITELLMFIASFKLSDSYTTRMLSFYGRGRCVEGNQMSVIRNKVVAVNNRVSYCCISPRANGPRRGAASLHNHIV